MTDHKIFNAHFLQAAAHSAAKDADLVNQLNVLKSKLEEDFTREFGEDAFMKYYIGREKISKHADYNYEVKGNSIIVSAQEPGIENHTFAIHFPHEDIADEYGINLVQLHGKIFKPYFMSAAMYQITGNKLYDELAGDILEEIEVGIQQNIREGHDPITKKEYAPLTDFQMNVVINALSMAIDTMVAHRRPLSLRLSDLIPTDRDV